MLCDAVTKSKVSQMDVFLKHLIYQSWMGTFVIDETKEGGTTHLSAGPDQSRRVLHPRERRAGSSCPRRWS